MKAVSVVDRREPRHVITSDRPDYRRFAELLRTFRERRGLSQHQLARRASVDCSYPSRLEHANHRRSNRPGRAVVEAIGAALDLAPVEVDELLLAAGHAPGALFRVQRTPQGRQAQQSMLVVSDVLLDERLSESERNRFATIIEYLAMQWRLAARRMKEP